MPDWQMVVIDNIPHLSVKDLIQFEFSQTFLDKQTSIGAYPTVYSFDPSQPTRKEVKLIPYTGIPESTRKEKNMPPMEVMLQRCREQQLTNLAGFDGNAYDYFLRHAAVKSTRTHTREHVAKSKAEQVSVLMKLAAIRNTEAKAMGFDNKESLYAYAVNVLTTLATERDWPAFKCTTVVGLRKRLKPFLQLLRGKLSAEATWESLLNKRVNNTNAQKLEADQRELLIQLYSDGNVKINTVQCYNIYTRRALSMIDAGLWTRDAMIAESTIRQFLYQPKIKQIWYEARHGKQEYRNVFEPVTLRQRPTFANALWVIDGTPSHRYFQNGDKGRYFRFNIFPVLDAHSWCIVGFWLSETENTDAVLGALRSACMVSGCLPYQVLYDSSSAIQSYRAQDAINKIALTAFPSTVGNARAKIIEPFFHHFNEDIQKFRPGFTHNPFAVRLDNRPNREALAVMVKSHELPRAEQALQQAIEDFTIWNNQPRAFLGNQSPLAAYRKSMQETASKQRPFTEAIDVAAFYALPGEQKRVRTMEGGKPRMVSTFVVQTYEYTNYGIEITINKRKCWYTVSDPSFNAEYIGQRFSVRYEPNPERWANGVQPDQLLLYVQGNPVQWQGVPVAAVPTERFAMAVADYREGEGAQLRKKLDQKKQQRALVQQRFEDIIEATKLKGTYTPVITDNAFDKKTLNDAKEEILNRMIGGADYRLGDGPTDDTDDDEPTSYDRLSGFDTPLPLD